MSGDVKFVIMSALALTPCHLNYNLYRSWDRTNVGRWTLQDCWLSHQVDQNTCR